MASRCIQARAIGLVVTPRCTARRCFVCASGSALAKVGVGAAPLCNRGAQGRVHCGHDRAVQREQAKAPAAACGSHDKDHSVARELLQQLRCDARELRAARSGPRHGAGRCRHSQGAQARAQLAQQAREVRCAEVLGQRRDNDRGCRRRQGLRWRSGAAAVSG